MQARRREGLRSFPLPSSDLRGLRLRFLLSGQDQLVQGQVRHRPAQPGILLLQILQGPNLVALQPAEFLASPTVRHLGNHDPADYLGDTLALRGQHIDLAQLSNYLFRLESFAWQVVILDAKNNTSTRTTSVGEDQSSQRHQRARQTILDLLRHPSCHC